MKLFFNLNFDKLLSNVKKKITVIHSVFILFLKVLVFFLLLIFLFFFAARSNPQVQFFWDYTPVDCFCLVGYFILSGFFLFLEVFYFFWDHINIPQYVLRSIGVWVLLMILRGIIIAQNDK